MLIQSGGLLQNALNRTDYFQPKALTFLRKRNAEILHIYESSKFSYFQQGNSLIVWSYAAYSIKNPMQGLKRVFERLARASLDKKNCSG